MECLQTNSVAIVYDMMTNEISRLWTFPSSLTFPLIAAVLIGVSPSLLEVFSCTWKKKNRKHCQRHNGPEGRVHLAKVSFWGHITSSNTNLDHISSSESRLSIKNLNQTSALNLKFKILAKPNFRISTKIQLHNLNQMSSAKFCPNFSFKILPELQLLNLDQILCS